MTPFLNVQNMFHRLAYSLTVQLVWYCSYAGVPERQCRACAGISSEWSCVTASPNCHDPACLLYFLCTLAIPTFPNMPATQFTY